MSPLIKMSRWLRPMVGLLEGHLKDLSLKELMLKVSTLLDLQCLTREVKFSSE